MRAWVFATFAFALAACGAREPTAQVSAAGECAVNAAHPWNAGGTTLSVEASTSGPDCALAEATLTIRDPVGDILWTEAYPSARVMTLSGATNPQSMQAALNEWISFENTTIPTSGALPEWPQGQPYPPNGEFPFYPEEGTSRADYMALRGRDAPLFCYVQGMESLACLVWENGALTKIGVQTFPG